MKNVFLDHKVEFFFLVNVLSAIFLKSLFLFHLCAIIFIFLFFIKEKLKYPLIIIVVALKIFLHFTFIIIDIDSANSNGIKYITINEKISLKDYYEPGTLIFKSYLKDIEKSDNDNYRLPLISYVLQYRKNFSESLYINSNGLIKLTQALIVGDRSFIPADTKDKFIVTGLIHLLAISGLHVAIITALLFFLLFFIPKKIRYIVICSFLLFYMPFAAFNVPVTRASLCAIIIMMLFFFDIRVDYRKFLLFIASFFMIISPTIIKDLSFIMSFLAVAGIVYLGFNSKNKLLNALYIGFAAQTSVIPITLYTFGMTNICSVLSTIIMLPFININIFIGLLSVVSPGVFAPILVYIEKIVLFIVNLLYQYTYNTFFLYKINLITFLVMIFIILFIFYIPKYRWLIFSVYLFFLFPVNNKLGYYIFKEYSNTFIVSMNNKKELYFNGDYYFYKYRLLPQLAKMKLKRFDNGKIILKDASNQYVKLDVSDSLNQICINKITENCDILYQNNYLQLQRENSNDLYHIQRGRLNFIPNKICY